MRKDAGAIYLTGGEYLSKGRNGLTQQVANARWQLLLAIKRHVPQFFENLHTSVYREFKRVPRPRDFRIGSSLSMWQSRADPDRRFAHVLTEWARAFNVDSEVWILEGAMRTLSIWNAVPSLRKRQDIQGFRQLVVVSGLVAPHESVFRFEDSGWDPTLISFLGWRTNLLKQFELAIKEHKLEMEKLVRTRGGISAVARATKDHFEWLARFQCGNQSLEAIAGSYEGRTNVSKGIHQAAKLLKMSIRKTRKLKTHTPSRFRLT